MTRQYRSGTFDGRSIDRHLASPSEAVVVTVVTEAEGVSNLFFTIINTGYLRSTGLILQRILA